jgi:hypothetical protein
MQEVCRIRNEHPDDPSAISKDRVKGSLKVTRAFGAGFLKQVSLCLILSLLQRMVLFRWFWLRNWHIYERFCSLRKKIWNCNLYGLESIKSNLIISGA